jgi:hypothetical protein
MKNRNEVIKFLVNCFADERCRTTFEVAQELLLENVSFVRGGKVIYLSIRNLGLGVYEVGPRSPDRVNTYLET